MYYFGQRSQQKIRTLHPDLKLLVYRGIKLFDFSVVWGYRDEKTQNALFLAGDSQLQWDKSQHNKTPSLAFDADPFPIDYENLKRYYFMAGIFKGIASEIGIKLRWGGDWNSNNIFRDNKFNDLGHFEIIE